MQYSATIYYTGSAEDRRNVARGWIWVRKCNGGGGRCGPGFGSGQAVRRALCRGLGYFSRPLRRNPVKRARGASRPSPNGRAGSELPAHRRSAHAGKPPRSGATAPLFLCPLQVRIQGGRLAVPSTELHARQRYGSLAGPAFLSGQAERVRSNGAGNRATDSRPECPERSCRPCQLPVYI